MDSVKTYTRLQRTDFHSPVSFLFFNIGSPLDTTYTSITYPQLVRTSFLACRPAKVLFTTDCSTAQPAKAAWSVGQHERISNCHQVTRSAAASQGVGILALQQLSERPSGGGQSDTNPQAFCACNLMRLRRPVCLSDGRRDCGRSYDTC